MPRARILPGVVSGAFPLSVQSRAEQIREEQHGVMVLGISYSTGVAHFKEAFNLLLPLLLLLLYVL